MVQSVQKNSKRNGRPPACSSADKEEIRRLFYDANLTATEIQKFKFPHLKLGTIYEIARLTQKKRVDTASTDPLHSQGDNSTAATVDAPNVTSPATPSATAQTETDDGGRPI